MPGFCAFLPRERCLGFCCFTGHSGGHFQRSSPTNVVFVFVLSVRSAAVVSLTFFFLVSDIKGIPCMHLPFLYLGSFTTFPNSKSRRTRSSKIHQYGGNLSRTTEKKRDSGPNPNVPVDSSGRRSLFSPQNAKNNQSHKIITIAQQLTDTSQPSTNTMTMQRAMNANFPPYEQPTQSASRPKSESINIKRLKGYDDSSHFDNSAERMYDWATWRMYHRITTARRSRASVVPYGTNNIKAVTDTSAHCSNLTHESDGHLSDRTPSLASLDYELEDEVFEIEI